MNTREAAASVDPPAADMASMDFCSDLEESIVPPFVLGKFSPAIADQYAALIHCYWRTALGKGEIAPSQAIDIIDLCATQGSAELLRRGIERRLHGALSLNVRYLPVLRSFDKSSSITAVATSQRPEYWRGSSLYWNPGNPDSLPSWSSSGTPYSPGNPLVVLAHDTWAQAEQRLYAIHYGKLLTASLEKFVADKAEDSADLWQVAGELAWDVSLTDTLKRYTDELNSSPIVYPLGAISIIRRLRSLSSYPLLIIAKASGHTEDLEIRLTSFTALAQEYRRTTRLPVNFQLLSKWIAGHHGAAECVAVGSREYVQVGVFGVPTPAEWVQKITKCIEPALFSGGEQLVAVSRSLGPSTSLESRMNLLQLSRYDPAVFLASYRELVTAFNKTKDFDRKAWRGALQRVWENRGACPADDDFHRHMATVAMHCGHWGFARKVLHAGLERFGENATDIAHLAWCEIRTGRARLGEELVQQALYLDAENPLAKQVSARLAGRANTEQDRWHVYLPHDRLPIVLEPMNENHVESYFHQYRDPQIAVMTGLPALSSIEETKKWFDSQKAEAGRVNFAVMHEDWGFVGFVNLAVSEHAAFFCFWVGVDFQGLGISSAAGRLVCQYAATIGVPVMLTSAYQDNQRSIRALKRIGFKELGTRALPPDHGRIFFSLVDHTAGEVDSHHELVNYYQRENLPMSFVHPDQVTDHETNTIGES